MIYTKTLLNTALLTAMLTVQSMYVQDYKTHQQTMVHIAEIKVSPDYRTAYLAILKEEAEASIGLESGVLVLFPMIQMETRIKSEFWKSM